jgi:CubicO group peptidase (beta-lactamase class C family)
MKIFNKRYMILALLFAVILTLPVYTQSNEKYAEKIKIFENFIKKQMEIDRTPALSIGFMKDDFVWTKGFGYADLENKTPATENSTYRLASVTKTMTAVTILQLVEKGKIDLDAEVQNYVPYFPRKPWPVTVRQLLGHLGGISHYKDYDAEGHIKVPKDAREAIAIFENFELVAEPGTRFNYSSYGYNLLGAIIEGAAKQPYGDYMCENIWGPLGMDNTYIDSPDNIIPGRVKGYRLIEGKIKNSEYVDISSRFAAGGTRSTVVDLLKFAGGVMHEKLLSQKITNEMFASMTTKDGRFTGYGMGWSINNANGRFSVSHSGGQAETSTWLILFPEENFAIAAACNFEPGNPYRYAMRLYQILMGEPWGFSMYTGDKVSAALIRAADAVFDSGLSYYTRYQKPLSDDQAELAKLFAQFNNYINPEAVNKDYEDVIKKISAGQHPVAHEAFVKIGSFMAAKLNEKFDSERFDYYHKMGSLTFFNDYIEMYSEKQDYPKELQFNESFVQAVKRFHQDWKKTSNEYTQNLIITAASDWNTLGKKLKDTFADTKVYPDFIGDLARAAEYYYIAGDKNNAFKVANLAVELYPESAVPYIVLANANVCFGDKNKAKELYKKASEAAINKNACSPESFARFANLLWDYGGKADETMDLLEIALELYPKSALLNYYMGAAYTEKSKIYYKKALEFDPQFEQARKQLKKIE